MIIANLAEIPDAYNLYVALTRARKTITIIGIAPSTTLTATKGGAHHEPLPAKAPRPR